MDRAQIAHVIEQEFSAYGVRLEDRRTHYLLRLSPTIGEKEARQVQARIDDRLLYFLLLGGRERQQHVRPR